jgi:hypothetical protein
MADRRVWEKVDTRRVDPDLMEHIFSVIFGPPESYWVVTYKDKVSGKEVTGYGKTLEEADKDAQRKLY